MKHKKRVKYRNTKLIRSNFLTQRRDFEIVRDPRKNYITGICGTIKQHESRSKLTGLLIEQLASDPFHAL